MVQNDPHAIYSFGQFNNETDELLDVIETRYNHLANAPALNVNPPTINSVEMESSNGSWASPEPDLSVTITAHASYGAGIDAVNLFYSTDVNGLFNTIEMDSQGDGLYSALIPPTPVGSVVRFYIEAVGGNDVGTRAYMPAGAEHDTYYYTVDSPVIESPQIAINELMSKNSITEADEAGEYDDWIELYNLTNSDVDISGWHLSDNPWNMDKWEFPSGTTINAGSYLIVWADEDGYQGDLHANFKLSGSGESLYLSTAEEYIVDQTDFPASEDDMGYARVPNGTGAFVFQGSTFNASNDAHSLVESLESNSLILFPNPATSELNLVFREIPSQASISIVSTSGQVVISRNIISTATTISVDKLNPGIYLVMIKSGCEFYTKRVVIQ